MSYKYSRGNRKVGDLQFEDDTNTEIDFEDDYIALEAAGTAVLVVSGSKVGVGTSTPSQLLTLEGTAPCIQFTEGGADRSKVFVNDSDNLVLQQQQTNKHIVMEINDAGTVREGFRLNGSVPEIVVNETSDSLVDFRVESNNNTHMLFIDGGNDKIGINTNNPAQILDINGDTIRLRNQRTIPNSNTFGEAGEICYDQNYIYICIATDTWRRVAISSW